MKFGVDVTPLVPSLRLYFLISFFVNTNVIDYQIREASG
jgi:hypothetical protein